MQTLSQDEFKKRYGDVGFKALAQPKPGFVDRTKQAFSAGLSKMGESFKESQAGRNPISTGAKFGAGAIETAFSPLTAGLEPAIKPTIGKGIEYASEKISDIPAVQKFATSKAGEVTSRVAEDVGNLNVIAGAATMQRLPQVGTGIAKATETGVNTIKGGMEGATQQVAKVTRNQSPAIMNRVARLKPTDANKFRKLSGGKTHGDYLSETGNFGSPDKIVATEAQKFAQSKLDVDNALSQLPGNYKVGALKDALGELVRKAKSVSSANVKSPYLDRVMGLAKKYNKEGLNMSEINEVKRLFERNVKLGYNKLLNADKVELATNVDDALREWQVTKAAELGFENIKEMNKQTQLSRFLVDKLGEQVTGKSGLNGVSLTDWIVLSGGNPQAVAGFLTKKFLSSASIQARIAGMLKQGETSLPIKPKINTETLTPKGSGAVRKTATQSSISQAKASGQSFDEWVKGHNKAFHGSDVADIIEKEGFKKMPIKTGVSAFGEGSYLTSSKANAKGYGGVVDAYLPKDIKLKKVFDSDAYKVDTQKLIKEGFDGVELETGQGKNITIFDPSKIKTRSQLKAEWDGVKNTKRQQQQQL